MKRIAIIHPWMPQYRETFFLKLQKRLNELGIDLDVFYGTPERAWLLRGDQVSNSAFHHLETKSFSILGRTLLMKKLGSVKRFKKYDLVIAEQAIRNLETYLLLFSGVKLAFWGHGRTYTQKSFWIIEKLKFAITKRGAWFFAYTSNGAKVLASAGFDPLKITVTNNTVDTGKLMSDLEAASDFEVLAFKDKHGIADKQIVLFLGALDASKKVRFLLDACQSIATNDENFHLLIVGDGPLRQKVVEFSKSTSWATYLGPLFGHDKSLALKAAKFMVIPGRVGLIAVDSLVSGRPIVTTADRYHPPEFDYLTDGKTCVVAGSEREDFAVEVSNLLSNSSKLESMAIYCLEASSVFQVENMVESFASGIVTCLTHGGGLSVD